MVGQNTFRGVSHPNILQKLFPFMRIMASLTHAPPAYSSSPEVAKMSDSALAATSSSSESSEDCDDGCDSAPFEIDVYETVGEAMIRNMQMKAEQIPPPLGDVGDDVYDEGKTEEGELQRLKNAFIIPSLTDRP